MKALGNKSVDLLLTDIPYNCSQESNGLRVLDYGVWDKDFDAEDFAWNNFRLTRGSIYVWCHETQLSFLILALRQQGFIDRPCSWVKRNPTVINGEKIWLPALELCAFGKRPAATFNAICKSAVWWLSPDTERFHPNQKPLEIIAAQIQASTNDGDTILDPFLGSGTTAVAALKLGRHFLGFEVSETYCQIARQRIALVEDQPNLFAPTKIRLTPELFEDTI
jgi:DNA modification methylase